MHNSGTAKVGIKPGNNIMGFDLEPVGIYTYAARDWLERLGGMPYRGFRYLHAITIKSGTQQASPAATQQLIARFVEDEPDHWPDYGASGQLTRYLISRGYGVVSQVGQGATESIILGRQFIEQIRTFDAYHPPRSGKEWADAGVAKFEYELDRIGLGGHAAFLAANPGLAQRLGIGSLSHGGPLHVWGAGPGDLSRIKLVVHALANGIKLTPEQERFLVLPHAIHTEDRNRYLDVYLDYSKPGQVTTS